MKLVEKGDNFASAYWVKGKSIYSVEKTHIDSIIDNPERFDLTTEEIHQFYKKNKEKIGTEGEARKQIIQEISKQGWIRVRSYKRPREYWSIQAFDIFRAGKAIKNFLFWAIDEGHMYPDEEIILFSYKSGEYMQFGYEEGGAKKYLAEKIKIKK